MKTRNWWQILLFPILLLIISVKSQSYPSGSTPIQGGTAVSAPLSLYAEKLRDCINPTIPQNIRFPTGQTIEGLISLVERLEDNLANTTDGNLAQIKGAESVARLLLRRFRLDGVDDYGKQNERDIYINEITNAFLGQPLWENNYYFPDYLFSPQEQCALLFSLSHNIANLNSVRRAYSPQLFRGKRQAINSRYRQQASNEPISSPFLVQRNTAFSNGSAPHPIREEGVVSFRGSKVEAIAPARVLIGVIAGLTQNIRTQVSDVLTALGQGQGTYDQQYNKAIDPVMAITIASLWGSGIASDNQTQDKSYYYGVSGEWHSWSCALHYSLTPISEDRYDFAFKTSKGTRAEIRGALDGYIIGSALKSAQISDTSRIRLSTILRTYYSKPRQPATTANTFQANYCQRPSSSQITGLQDTATLYNAIYQIKRGGAPTGLLSEFTPALTAAAQVETTQGFSDYCSQRPSGILDKTAPCETPTNILFIIDGIGNNNLQISGDVVTPVSGNSLFTRRGGGTVSVFINSQGRNSVNPNIQLPTGPGDWPLVAAAFNTTNTGCASCRIEDFNQTTLTAVPNLAKYYQYLNQTLFNFKYWSPFINYTGAPSTSAVVIDLNTVSKPADSGQERNDYNYYVDQLRNRNRQVRYLAVSQNSELFQDLLRNQNDRDVPGTVGNPNYNLGSNFAAKACENPAVFQWRDCFWRKSDNAQYTGYVTPGYKQNWAMYPEYFLKSFNIEFRFKSESGSIKVCYDRYFPPENQNYCQELAANEEKVFTISNPCKGRSFESCDPFYFTVWGKESQTQCLDDGCSSLDQIKWTAKHSGVQCNSSQFVSPSIVYQLIAITISAIFYLFFNENN